MPSQKPSSQQPDTASLKVALSVTTFLSVVFLITSIIFGFLLFDGTLTTIQTNITRNSILNIIDRDYIGEIPTDESQAEGELRGLVGSLKDPYSQYLSEDETKQFRDSINEEYQGIGVRFSDRDGIFVITQVMSNGPAEAAGVEVEDVLIEIEGESVVGQTLDEVVLQIRGPKGTEINLTFLRGDEEVNVTIERDEIQTDLITLTIEDSIAIIRITSFGDEIYSRMRTISRQIVDDPSVEAIIVDLRSNTGGILQEGINATSYFVNDNDIVAFEIGNDDQRTDRARSVDTSLKQYPLAIVVDQYTASASEIMAAGIRENRDDVLIIGETTFGKGVVQKLFPLPNGGTLKLTVAEWLTPDRNEINDLGITPDIEVDGEEALERAKGELKAIS
jgi:carboxyl-terminal processing protease